MKRAVFLDRDGTLIVEKNYLRDPKQVELLPGAGLALRRLQELGFLLVLVTNQSGIGRGYFTVGEMHQVHDRLAKDLERDGVRLNRIYFAPEAPDLPSRGRKPSPQFLFDARDELGIDIAQSYLIGDKLIDLQCGWNADVKQAILVRTGYGAECEQKLGKELGRTVVVDDLTGAADWISAQETAPGAARARRAVGVIPARYGSTRFPGKPLVPILGRPLIQWVVERCRLAKVLDEVIVATDDVRIARVVEAFCAVEMTRTEHPSGSDRIAEVVERCGGGYDLVLNIQGD